MAYTIRIPIDQACFKPHPLASGNALPPVTTLDELVAIIRAGVFVRYDIRDWTEYIAYSRKREQLKVIELRGIRLKPDARKEYCGQHAGPCVAFNPRPLKKGLWLESADWILLHNVINMLLDLSCVTAEIWTTRVDQFRAAGCPVSRFIVRSLTLGGRKRYDYIDTQPANRGLQRPTVAPHFAFDPGTSSQFGEELPYLSEQECSELLHIERVDSWKNHVVATR